MRLLRTGILISILAAASLAVSHLSPGDARAGGGQQIVTITGADICGNTVAYPRDGDYDRDGLTNAQECDGLVKPPTGGPPYVTIPGYANRGARSRMQYLDPSQIDLFVWLEPAALTNIPADNVSVYSNGLGAAIHLIGAGDVGSSSPSTLTTDLYRAVTATQGPIGYVPAQKAVRVTEDIDTTLTDVYGTPLELAVTNWGTPNGSGEITIFTNRIEQAVANRCRGYATCRDYAGTTGLAAVQDLYFRHTMGHELGHMSKLTRTTDSAGNHHYAAESYSVMEASIAAKQTSTKNGGTMTFWISTGFVTADKTDAKTGGY